MMSEELLPCPWCGLVPVVVEHGWIGEFSVVCRGRDCPVVPTTSGKTRAGAIAAWNRRAVPAVPPKVREVISGMMLFYEMHTRYLPEYLQQDIQAARAWLASLDAQEGK